MQDNQGKHAWAIYVMTPLTGNYKMEVFDTDANADITTPVTYQINDGLLAYDITINCTEPMDIIGGTTKNVVTVKLFTMSFAIVVIMAITLFGYVKDKASHKF